MNDNNAQTPEDQFVTPPVFTNQQSEFDGSEHGHILDSSGSDLNLLDNAGEEFEFEDDQRTPGLALAGPTVTTEVRRHSTEKAMLEATLTNLRSKLSDIEKDDWLYEGPRHSCT
jgi:hypothetical protein